MRAQVTIEFVLIVMILLAAVAIVTTVSVNKLQDVDTTNLQRNANDVLASVGDTINTVYLEGDGFKTNITLPDTIQGAPYNVFVSSNYLIVTARNITFSRVLLTEVSGSLHTGQNVVWNTNGMVNVQ